MPTKQKIEPLEPILLNIHQVAKLLGISPRHVWNLLERGEFPKPRRLGRSCRWSAEKLRAWANR